MIKNLPWAEILVTTLALAAGVGVYLYAHRHEDSLEESKRRGAAVVQALRAYHHQHGAYPDALDRLVPEYTAVIRPPTWGLKRWRYHAYSAAEAVPNVAAGKDREFFQLSVAADASGYPVLYYDLHTQRWVLNN